jgi:hypothetical protein
MSKPVRSRSKSKGRRDEEESVELIEPVVVSALIVNVLY